ncbi:MAG TPA: RES family NAD+ phosphorylase [Streptosporangiaceae bacterium]|nr:RES family NAD+ phosphorylase [Streptosporangiaceae bacterium]
MTPAGPPPDKAIPALSPSLVKLDAGTLLWRVHSTFRPAICFKDQPTDEVFGGGRFDATQADPYPFLYAAPAAETAILETVSRDVPFHASHFRTIRQKNVAGLTLSPVLVITPLTLISLMNGIELASALQDGWLIQCESHDYPKTRRWARWLRLQVPAAQGIAWPSRRNVGSQAVVLFGDRCDSVLELAGEPPIDLASPFGADWLNQVLKPYRIRITPPRPAAATMPRKARLGGGC